MYHIWKVNLITVQFEACYKLKLKWTAIKYYFYLQIWKLFSR